ncbi:MULTISPECIES: hypothetical protein [Chryseobacterium]|uniref:hypothetical protein n=1 Tax=Chryseobacterium TaxID=59732 RepID=UPI001297E25C|nr:MULTISPECIES: hypothetical protein [Chryseobacterium]MDR6922124.1 hypothetical protein [Chryseobacterium sp. 2987]
MKNTFVFPFLCLILVMTFSCKDPERKKTNVPNDLKNTHWIVDAGGLIKPDGEKTYDLSPRIDTALIFNFHAINFLDDEKFESYDSWECGNDCFTEIYGRYYLTEVNRIEMEVDSIRQSGTCEAPVKIFKPAETMAFTMVKQGKQLQLMKK